jgi:hypothetical protein
MELEQMRTDRVVWREMHFMGSDLAADRAKQLMRSRTQLKCIDSDCQVPPYNRGTIIHLFRIQNSETLQYSLTLKKEMYNANICLTALVMSNVTAVQYEKAQKT